MCGSVDTDLINMCIMLRRVRTNSSGQHTWWKVTATSRSRQTAVVLARRVQIDFSYRAARIRGASSIRELGDSPGGGYLVTVEDAEGFPVNLIFGQSPAESGPLPTKLLLNYEGEKPRLDAFQRFGTGPAAVHKVSPVQYHTSRSQRLIFFEAGSLRLDGGKF